MFILKLPISKWYHAAPLLFWCIPSLIILSLSLRVLYKEPSVATANSSNVTITLYSNRNSLSPSSNITNIPKDIAELPEDSSSSADETQSQTAENSTTTESHDTPPGVSHKAKIDFNKPVYPPLSKRLGEEGDVYLIVTVNENDSITDIIIERSSGFSRLDNAAVAAIKNAKVQSAMLNGRKTVDSVRMGPFKFRIIESD